MYTCSSRYPRTSSYSTRLQLRLVPTHDLKPRRVADHWKPRVPSEQNEQNGVKYRNDRSPEERGYNLLADETLANAEGNDGPTHTEALDDDRHQNRLDYIESYEFGQSFPAARARQEDHEHDREASVDILKVK